MFSLLCKRDMTVSGQRRPLKLREPAPRVALLGPLWSHQISMVSNARWIPCCLCSSQNVRPALSLSHLLQDCRLCLNPLVFQYALKSCSPLLAKFTSLARSHAAVQNSMMSRESTFTPCLDNTFMSSCPLTPLLISPSHPDTKC